MFDKLVDWHKNPINQLLHLVGFVVGVYGLWQHDWNVIIASIIILIIGHLFPYKKKMQKKAAFELSMTTIVVIVLAMTMLILGLTLVKKIFTGAIGNVQRLDDKVKEAIDELILEKEEELIFYLTKNTAEIPQGTDWGIAFGFSPDETGLYTYTVKLEKEGIWKDLCPGITETNAENILGIGKSGDFGKRIIYSGAHEYGLIKLLVPKTFPLGCQIRYVVSIKKDGRDYTGAFFDVKVVRKRVAGIF